MKLPWILASLLGLALSAAASGTPLRAAGTLQLEAPFLGKYAHVACPAGTPASTACISISADAAVPGLGQARETYTLFWDQSNPDCWHSTWTPTVITVAGKGELDASLRDPNACDEKDVSVETTTDFTITGGSGAYAGATGGGTIRSRASETGFTGDTWSGSLEVAGAEFDTAPPVISGAVSRVIRARRGVRRVRVTYAVQAQDAVDGAVAVTCYPRSGSRFPTGRTIVTCSATDSSANTARAKFRVTVRRGGG